MINPVWLRSFCTLVEVGHFTRTAADLHMTQSGVSQHVRKLEEYLGQPLLVRQGKRFTLTSTGERLYREGQQLILSLADLETRITQDPAYEGVVKVASPGSVGLLLYPHLLGLQKRHPKLVVEYRFAPNSDVERMIAEHKVDLGLMTRLATVSDVSLKPVAEEELLLVTPASVTEPGWDQLVELGFVDHPDGAYHAGQLLGVNFPQFRNSSQFRKSGFSNQIHLILEPVSMGLGFTVLPGYAVGAFKEIKKVNAHRLAHPVSETLYIGTHANRTSPNRVVTVISEVEKCLQGAEV
ncbi:MAG: LysR family transcriptional regulator [Gammaproteobacteria bacterium]|uniref:LysR family transcriptional regulator n=1 Tax=Pseudomaricurvus alcaniphilus TaxID=1166482 RepID=UPI00140E2370|nr:LysR family transcriptional regulator [Pseudomaricurvus alcaniphilus]MBR9910929.1 LysR family transcriptional regulator [Gammaproteobacteria bacterium]NHN37169.1 LysR family transcriptional regulator [Pseudomaricurvus alcaniphilus]